jgi:hypothetical protein
MNDASCTHSCGQGFILILDHQSSSGGNRVAQKQTAVLSQAVMHKGHYGCSLVWDYKAVPVFQPQRDVLLSCWLGQLPLRGQEGEGGGPPPDVRSELEACGAAELIRSY